MIYAMEYAEIWHVRNSAVSIYTVKYTIMHCLFVLEHRAQLALRNCAHKDADAEGSLGLMLERAV